MLESRAALDEIRLDPKIRDYIVDLVSATRSSPLTRCGASTRAAISLALAAKTEALLEGRAYVVPQDVKSVAPDVLRHRILLNYDAGETSSALIERLLKTVPLP